MSLRKLNHTRDLGIKTIYHAPHLPSTIHIRKERKENKAKKRMGLCISY